MKLKPCDDCPWVESSPKHKLTYEIEGVREAVRRGSKILCHARGGHPPCVGAKQWRNKQLREAKTEVSRGR